MATATMTNDAQARLAELNAERARLEAAGASFGELAANSAAIRELVFAAAGMGANGTAGAVKEQRDEPEPTGGVITFDQIPPATDDQREFFAAIAYGNAGAGEADVSDTVAWLAEPARRKVEVDACIDELLIMLQEKRAERIGTLGTEEIPTPSGRYAVGESLYRVDVVTEGPWAGTIGLYKITNAPGVPGAKVTGGRKREILDTIAADAISTLRGFGKITGRCGGCDQATSGLAEKYGAHADCLARM